MVTPSSIFLFFCINQISLRTTIKTNSLDSLRLHTTKVLPQDFFSPQVMLSKDCKYADEIDSSRGKKTNKMYQKCIIYPPNYLSQIIEN